MSDKNSGPNPAPNPQPLDPDLVFFVLNDATRRRFLVSLARGGPRTAADLAPHAGQRVSASLKHLKEMCDAGIVVVSDNPQDGRRQLYGLSPAVVVTKTETGLLLNFGCCFLPV